MLALLSVLTSAPLPMIMVTSAKPFVNTMFSTRPTWTPAILTASPILRSCTFLKRACKWLPRWRKPKLPRYSRIIRPRTTAKAKKMPNLLSMDSFISSLVFGGGKFRTNKSLHDRIGAAPHFLGRPNEGDAPLVDHGDAMGRGESQIAVMGDDDGS